MTYPWDILDISAKIADVSTVKRAYAKQLKKCRPDEDPEGFQIVLKARDQALWLLENLDIITVHDPKRKSSKGHEGQVKRASVSRTRGASKENVDLGLQDRSEAVIEVFSHVYFEKELEKIKCKTSEVWNLSYWKAFLNALNQAQFSCRQDIEWLLIDFIGKQFLKDQNILVKPVEKDKIFSVLLLLNEAFGWDADDKKVYHVLGNSNADFILGLIRSALFNGNSFNEDVVSLHPEEKKSTVPYIAIPDLRAYMGGAGEDIIHDYLWAWRRNKWQHSFNGTGFLLGYIWQAWRSFWRVGVGILLLQTCVVMLLELGQVSSVIKIVVIATLIVLPLFMIARYGNYWVIQAAYKAIKRAEKHTFQNTVERYDFLQKAGRGNFLFIFLLITLPIIFAIVRFSF